MYSVDTHPSRRKGEKNFSDPGRNWGPASHIVPGRRINEPNYNAWHSPVALLARSRSGFDLIQQASKDVSDITPPTDAYEEMALAMVKTIGDSVTVLKSIADIMPVIERMLTGRHGEGLHEEIRQPDKAAAPDHGASEARNSGLCWSSDMMVEIHNLCAQNRQCGQAYAKAIRRYDIDADPGNDILPPLRYYKDE